jgi:hypothetical protein
MLLEAVHHVRENHGDDRTLWGKLFAQEKNLTTSAIARMNLFLHGASDFQVVRGDTLRQPAFFSGDTIVHRGFQREMLLPRLWGRHVFALAEQVRDRRVWWFLISSGYTTYRFLPVFFRTFYPAFDRPFTGEARALLDDVAGRKFPREYDPAAGVIRLLQPSPVRPGVAELTPERLRDPHVSFSQPPTPAGATARNSPALPRSAVPT